MTRQEFREHASVLPVQINGVPFGAVPKEFSTGSLGWNVSQKMDVLVNGQPQKVQVGLNLTIVGSKELPA